MARRLKVGIFFICLLVVAASPAFSNELGSVIEKAEALIETEEVENIREAIALLEDVLDSEQKNGRALWMMAKAHLYLGDRVLEDELSVFEAGKVFADQAVEVLPESPDAYYWQSALIGRIGQTRGVLQSLFMVRPMKDALDRVLELDPQYAPAYFVLSMLYTEAPGWPLSIGSKSKALENAKRAVELSPDDIEYNVNLAEVLVDNNKETEAIGVLRSVLAMPHIDEEPEFKSQAEELLSELVE